MLTVFCIGVDKDVQTSRKVNAFLQQATYFIVVLFCEDFFRRNGVIHYGVAHQDWSKAGLPW